MSFVTGMPVQRATTSAISSGRDLLAQEALLARRLRDLLLLLRELLLELAQPAVLERRRLLEVVGALGLGDAPLGELDLLAHDLERVDRLLLRLPLRRHRVRARLELGELLLQRVERRTEAGSLSFFSASRSISSCVTRRVTSSSSAASR
jgi:hypothetical protein